MDTMLKEHPTPRALAVFNEEVPGHISFFKSLALGLAPLSEEEAIKVLDDEAIAITGHAHMLKGGAGFLGLKKIRTEAMSVEDKFKSKAFKEFPLEESVAAIAALLNALQEHAEEHNL